MPKYRVALSEIWTTQRYYEVEAESETEAEIIAEEEWEAETNSMTDNQLRAYLEFASVDVLGTENLF
jgi:hypothetical protein